VVVDGDVNGPKIVAVAVAVNALIEQRWG